jgi:hypothetical protein
VSPTRVATWVLAAAVAAAVPGITQAYAVTSAGPPPALAGNVEPALDVVPSGDVTVVAASAPVRDGVAFVVQNGTDRTVRVTRVTAVAQQPDGAQAARASTRDIVPARLAPGEVAIGDVEFRAGTIAPDPVLTWAVGWGRVPSAPDPLRLAVGELELSPPRGGSVAQTLDLEVTNPSSARLAGPLAVRVLCLNEARRPVLVASANVHRGKLRPAASAHVTVELRELCPSYLVGAAAAATAR